MNNNALTELILDIHNIGINLDHLYTKIIIEGYFTNETPLRIGKGAGEFGEVDLPIIIDAYGKPYIPGSSLKGILRTTLEEIIRPTQGTKSACNIFAYPQECALKSEILNKMYWCIATAIDINSALTCIERSVININVMKSMLRRYHFGDIEPSYIKDLRAVIESRNIQKLRSVIINQLKPCIACRVFGNQSLASHVIVYDSYPQGEVLPQIRTRVAVDRFRAAALSGALFKYQYIPQGYEWKFRLDIRNIDIISCEDEVSKSFNKLLKYFAIHGIMIGGMRSVGHGLIKLNAEKTIVSKYIVKDFDIKLVSKTKLHEIMR